MRLVNASPLFERAVELEAVAFKQAIKYDQHENPIEWHRWTSILKERTDFKYDIMDAPTIDAEPIRHGHWIFNPKDAIETMFTLPKCSECGAESPNGGNYCPNCGAKMDVIYAGKEKDANN